MGRWCYFYRLYSSSRSFLSFSSDDFHHICLALFPLILLSLQPHAETHRVDVFLFLSFPCVPSSHSPLSSFTSSLARPLLVLVHFLLSSAVSGRCGVFMGSIPLCCCCCCCCRAYVIHSNVPKQHRARWRENKSEERKEGWK